MKKFMVLIFCTAVFLLNGCSCKKTVPYTMEKNAILIDVRTPEEYQQKHIKIAVNIPLADIAGIAKIVPDKNTPIYLYCRSGRRSNDAMNKLLRQGYNKVIDLGSMSNAEKKLVLH